MPGLRCLSIASCLFILLLSSPPASADELEILPLPDEGWVIASKRTVQGVPISLSGIGHEIDAHERRAHRLFEGAVFPDPLARRHGVSGLLHPFNQPITGFASASFFESPGGDPFLVIRSIHSDRSFTRIQKLKPAHIDALIQHLGLEPGYARVSDTLTRIEVSRDLSRIAARQKASVTVGDRVFDGHLLGVWDSGSIYMALVDGSTEQIDPSQVDRLTIRRSILSQVMGSTIGYGIQGALTGGVAGLFAGLTSENLSVGEEMKFGAVTGGIVGLGIGLLSGMFQAEGSETYEFTPVVTPDAYELFLTMEF